LPTAPERKAVPRKAVSMRASSIQSLLLAGALAVMARVTVTLAEESVSTVPSLPATLQPAVPVTLGRPHGGAYDPHARLDPETQIRIALRHQAEGRPREALDVLSKAIAGPGDDARLYAVRGSLMLEAGRVAPALADLGQAARLDPDDAETLTNRAQAYRRFGRIDQALADLDRALEIAPDLLAARFNRGAMRYGIGDYQGALEDFDRCVALDPHSPGPYFNRASVKDVLGDKEAAIADLDRFLRISRNKTWNEQARQLRQILENPENMPATPEPNPHR